MLGDGAAGACGGVRPVRGVGGVRDLEEHAGAGVNVNTAVEPFNSFAVRCDVGIPINPSSP